MPGGKSASMVAGSLKRLDAASGAGALAQAVITRALSAIRADCFIEALLFLWLARVNACQPADRKKPRRIAPAGPFPFTLPGDYASRRSMMMAGAMPPAAHMVTRP